MTEEKNTVTKHGRPWDVNGRYQTFEEADARRNDLLSSEDNCYDVKVRRLSVGNQNWAFFVKTRLKEGVSGEKKNVSKRVRRKTKKSKKQQDS